MKWEGTNVKCIEAKLNSHPSHYPLNTKTQLNVYNL